MPTVKAFRSTGKFVMGRRWQPFTKEFIAKNKEECAEFTYSILGSNHRIKRKFIRIEKIEEIKKVEDVKDPAVKERLMLEVKK